MGRAGAWVLGAGLCLLLLSGAWAADPAEGPGAGEGALNLWPVYDRRDDPVDRMHVQSGLGPLVESQRAPEGSREEFALRPLFHRREERRFDRLEWEVLYPLMSYSRSERDYEFQFIQLIHVRGEGSRPEDRERRADFFPFYMSGTTETGETYHAVLPFGGRVFNRLGQDEADWVMFPLYAHFVKQGAETYYFPWPLVSRTRGEARTGFRVVPFYGEERKAGVFEKRFVLWPFFLQQRTGLDGDDPEETLALLPFYIGQHSKTRDSTTILWPLFNYTQDRERGYEQWDAPWPLIKIARGEGRTIHRFLPFFSVEHRLLRHEFFLREMRTTNLIVLFPLYLRSEEEIPGGRTVRDRILWWLYSDQREEGRDGSARRVDAWPFFRYTRDRKGGVAFQSLALLEAFMPGNDKIEQNYSPLWALYTYRRSPEGDSVRSFLWNLIRHEERSAGGRSIEVLGPLLAYREQGAAARFSLLGGLFEYEVRRHLSSLRLFGHEALTWRGTPQPLAALPPAGGNR